MWTRSIATHKVNFMIIQIKVQCLANEGVYNLPTLWPNCTETVWCGPPPLTTVNGSRDWIQGEDGQVVSNIIKNYKLCFKKM